MTWAPCSVATCDEGPVPSVPSAVGAVQATHCSFPLIPPLAARILYPLCLDYTMGLLPSLLGTRSGAASLLRSSDASSSAPSGAGRPAQGPVPARYLYPPDSPQALCPPPILLRLPVYSRRAGVNTREVHQSTSTWRTVPAPTRIPREKPLLGPPPLAAASCVWHCAQLPGSWLVMEV